MKKLENMAKICTQLTQENEVYQAQNIALTQTVKRLKTLVTQYGQDKTELSKNNRKLTATHIEQEKEFHAIRETFASKLSKRLIWPDWDLTSVDEIILERMLTRIRIMWDMCLLMLPSKQDPQLPPWQPDESGVCCAQCAVKFSSRKRRHHCRLCGQLFCDDCTRRHKDGLKNFHHTNCRVCNGCFVVLQITTSQTTNQSIIINSPTSSSSTSLLTSPSSPFSPSSSSLSSSFSPSSSTLTPTSKFQRNGSGFGLSSKYFTDDDSPTNSRRRLSASSSTSTSTSSS